MHYLDEGKDSYPLSCWVTEEKHLSECLLLPAPLLSCNFELVAWCDFLSGCALTAMTNPQLATGPQK